MPRSKTKRAKRPTLADTLPEQVAPVTFTIPTAARTKNTGKVVKGGKVIPPAPWRKWLKAAQQQVPLIRAGYVRRGNVLERGAPPIPGCFKRRVEVTAVWYRDADRGDEDRYKVGTGDLLQRLGFVANDDLIHWSGECRRDLDRENPRTEVTIRLMEGA
jgi:hypothetical protein